MKNFALLMFSLLGFLSLSAQQNMTLISNLQYTEDANDVWGYEAPDGTEYALVGLRNGVSVVNLSDPTNPVESDYVPGTSSTWRDMKVFGDYAYFTTDEGGDGLGVIDLSPLPDSVNYSYWQPTLNFPGESGQLLKAHNIYIDENGIAYIAGSNLNFGGMLFVDVATTPGSPAFIAPGPARYSHDVFVRNDTMWSSDINEGYFSVVDVSDKLNTVLLSTQNTPFFFTHNSWLSDDGKTLFTTDEQANAPVASYDVSDMSNIQILDEFRPPATVGQGVIPHNTHTLGNYQVVSYYTDGVVVIDATMPDWLVQVGQYDTYAATGTGFFGCWGAYPFLNSGLLLLSDINTGLYVLQPNYQRACYLKGTVTDFNSGATLDGVTVSFDTEPVNASTDLAGIYKTGLGTPGTYNVTFSRPAYMSETVQVSLVSGQITVEDVVLTKLPSFSMSGQVVSAANGNPIPGAVVDFQGAGFSEGAVADGSGNFTIPNLVVGTYDVIGGKWGYKANSILGAALDQNNNTITIMLDEGYYDEFALDLGWSVSGNATTGIWELADPLSVTIYGLDLTPPSDLPGDIGEKCFVTGNNSDLLGGRVSGETILTSPVFDLTGYMNPVVSYTAWFFSASQNQAPTAQRLRVYLDNGTTKVMVEEFNYSLFNSANWRDRSDILVTDHLPVTNDMTISFETDDNTTAFITEAGVDIFEVTDNPVANEEVDQASSIMVVPNPSSEAFNITFDVSQLSSKSNYLTIYNALGQQVENIKLNNQSGNTQIGKDLPNGVYLLQLNTQQGSGKGIKLIKTN